MPGSLEVLKQYRDDLLLAEVAAWLHNWDKFNDKKIAADWGKGILVSQSKVNEWHARNLDFKVFDSHLTTKRLMGITLKELAKFGSGVSLTHPNEFANYLARCHGAAHIEKELGDGENTKLSCDFISSPFGVAQEWPQQQYFLLQDFRIPENLKSNRTYVRQTIGCTFAYGWGDTRLPLNEVTLWDWAHSVAALYKAALAGAFLLTQKTRNLPDPNTLRWRFLALRFDGIMVVDRSPNIPALLARRAWVKEGLDKVQKLLEEDYPIGTEVYRDSNGSLFVVPDIQDLLEYTNSRGQTLRSLIQHELDSVLQCELLITPLLDERAWWAQDPRGRGKDEIPPIAEWLVRKGEANPDPAAVKQWWTGRNAEPCRISGVRPQGPSQKGIERKLSDFWLERTGKRSEEWTGKPETTIWMSEIADINGRVALIAASLDLRHWLTPDGLVNTLLVIPPQQGDPESAKKKTPSFARLHRIWETCAGFWEESVKKQLASLMDTIGPRLTIGGDLDGTLAPYHAYEIYPRSGISLEVVWDKQQLVAIANLQYVARQMGAETEDCSMPDRAAQWLAKYLQEQKEIVIYEPELSDSRQKIAASLRNIKAEIRQDNYLPAIDVLSEPQQFMILVPATKGLDVARYIKSEYEARFSKVKNRLPLHLNIVFFDRKQPMYAAIDAARRMLRRSSSIDTAWVVKEVAPAETAAVSQGSQERLDSHVMKMTLHRRTGESALPQLNNCLETEISYGTEAGTEDDWYPYVFVRTTVTDKPLSSRHLVFQAPLPGHADEVQLVHVKELQVGDEIYYAPSTFDFGFLDVTVRRFELLYDEVTGMRLPRAHEAYATRPFLLEELDVMQDLWALIAQNALTRRTITQLRQITGVIEAKRLDWQISSPDDSTLSRFVEHVLRRSFGKFWSGIGEAQEVMIRWATSGRWRDLMELYLSILKLR